MGAAPFSCTRFVLRPFLRGMVAYLGLPQCYTPAVFRHVLPAESSSARIDAQASAAESPWLDLKHCRAGLQYRGRGLFNPLDYPVGAAGLKSAIGSGGYLKRNTELRRGRHLHSRYLPIGRCFDFSTID